MMDPRQLLDYIITPAITLLGGRFAAPAAGILLLATCAQESQCGRYVRQIHGPARGIFQCEPMTHEAVICWTASHSPVCESLLGESSVERLDYDLRYATHIARLLFYSVAAPLPSEFQAAPMWDYYKAHYNSPAGAATWDQFRDRWNQFVEPIARHMR